MQIDWSVESTNQHIYAAVSTPDRRKGPVYFVRTVVVDACFGHKWSFDRTLVTPKVSRK